MSDRDAASPITTEQRLPSPLNGVIYTTTRNVPAEKRLPKIGSAADSELGSAWADSIIIDASFSPSSNKRQMVITHARIPSIEDQLASNWERMDVNSGIGMMRGVARTFIYRADEFNENTPALATPMPIYGGGGDVPSAAVTNQFSDADGYILYSRDVAGSGASLEPVFRVERRIYIKRSTVQNIGVDSLNGLGLTSITEFRHRSEIAYAPSVTYATAFASPTNAFWGVQADGFQRTGRPINDEWYEITREQVVAGTNTGGVISVSTYNSVENYYWPPVLEGFEILSWARRDGGQDRFPRYQFRPAGYNGPCQAQVVRSWSKTPQSVSAPQQMLPTSVHYASPYFSLNIPECLHPIVNCVCDIGNADPVYKLNSGSLRSTPATNFLTWPPSIIASDDQESYRGGFLRTRVTIYPPSPV